MKKQQSGFTLIELMIVVAIIGILAAIAVPQYQNFMARSQASEAIVMLDAARTSIEDKVVFDGNFAADKTELATIGVNKAGTYGDITGTQGQANNKASGNVVYKYKSSGVNQELKTKSVWYNRTNAGTWSCLTDLSATYAPKGCTVSQSAPTGT